MKKIYLILLLVVFLTSCLDRSVNPSNTESQDRSETQFNWNSERVFHLSSIDSTVTVAFPDSSGKTTVFPENPYFKTPGGTSDYIFLKEDVDNFKTDTWYFIFEDAWPWRGDYDFNDYQLRLTQKTFFAHTGQIDSLYIEIIPEVMGAYYDFRLGINWFSSTDNTLTRHSPDFIRFRGSGQPANGAIISQSLKSLDWEFNSFLATSSTADTLKFTFTVSSDQDLNGQFLEPFLYLENGGLEIHTAGIPPTADYNTENTGLGFDTGTLAQWNAQPGSQFEIPTGFFLSERGFPWGIKTRVPENFTFLPAIERVNIANAYPLFNTWVGTNGTQNSSWWLFPDVNNTNNIKKDEK